MSWGKLSLKMSNKHIYNALYTLFQVCLIKFKTTINYTKLITKYKIIN
jgi:hypothetical protein